MNAVTPSLRLMRVAALAALLVALPAAAADGAKTRIKGLVTAVHGDTITVKDGNNVEQGRAILDELAHPLVTQVDTMDGAADKAAELANA